MRHLFFLLLALLALSVQGAVPQVPDKLEFAGMTLIISNSAKNDIQKDVERIHRSQTYFNSMVRKADLYFPIIERVFKEEKFPDEIKYLVIQESALNPDAVSSANAVGYWQFKKGTAIEVGLTVDGPIDERKNIEAASRGAATYMKKNNGKLDNMVYALTSYNTGLGGVQKHIKTKYLGARKMNIDNHTHWYFIKFLAHYIAYRDYVGKTPHEKMLKVDQNQSGNSIKQVARQYGLSVEELDPFNRWIPSGKKIPEDKTYSVIVPLENTGEKLIVEENEFIAIAVPDEAPTADVKDEQLVIKNELAKVAPSSKITFNKLPAIKAGPDDNINSLARKGGIDRKKFLRYNDMERYGLVKPGKIYYLHRKKRKSKDVRYHVAKEGESLWDVAQFYGIRVNSLRRRNDMRRRETLRAGRVLWLQEFRPLDTPIEYRDINPEEPKQLKKVDKEEETSLDTFPSGNTQDVVSKTGQDDTVQIKVEEEAVQSSDVQLEIDLDVKDSKGDEEDDEPSNEVIKDDLHEVVHVVTPGQTLYTVSRLHGVSIDEIKEWNALSNDGLSVGQELIIKKSNNEVIQTEIKEESSGIEYQEHTVVKGETLYGISKKYGVSINDILIWNNKENPTVSIGEKLKIQKK